MKTEKATQTIHRALVAYIEDCSGTGTTETKDIEAAWAHIMRLLRNETNKVECEVWRINVSNVAKSDNLRLIVNGELDHLYDLNQGNWWVAVKPSGERICEYRSAESGYCAEVCNVSLTALTHERMVQKICAEIDGDNYEVTITNINN